MNTPQKMLKDQQERENDLEVQNPTVADAAWLIFGVTVALVIIVVAIETTQAILR